MRTAPRSRAVISMHKEHRELLHGGDTVRFTTDPAFNAHGVYARDRSRAIVSFAQLTTAPSQTPPPLRMPGLDLDARYRVKHLRIPRERWGPARTQPAWLADGITLSRVANSRRTACSRRSSSPSRPSCSRSPASTPDTPPSPHPPHPPSPHPPHPPSPHPPHPIPQFRRIVTPAVTIRRDSRGWAGDRHDLPEFAGWPVAVTMRRHSRGWAGEIESVR